MDRLPTVVIAKILQYSGEGVVSTLAQVCQHWNDQLFGVPTDDQRLWNLLLTKCGWPGTGRRDFLSHLKAIKAAFPK
jgi:hypothetical protein